MRFMEQGNQLIEELTSELKSFLPSKAIRHIETTYMCAGPEYAVSLAGSYCEDTKVVLSDGLIEKCFELLSPYPDLVEEFEEAFPRPAAAVSL